MRIPVLWLSGPPGVGKTTVAWQIFTDLADAGIRTGYVDIDQLGICYPDPPDDPDRHRMQARNLRAVVAAYRDAGARCVVVSGVVDPLAGVPDGAIGDVALTVVRLRADPNELRERFLGRGFPGEAVDGVPAEAEAGERGDVGLRVDTTGRSVAEVVELVRDRVGEWPPPSEDAGTDGLTPAGDASGPVLWLCGPTGVGKSTVGFQVWIGTQRAGMMSAYVDLDQIGFLRPAPADDPHNHRVRARSLAAVWRTYRAAGAECLVVVGPVEDQEAVGRYTAALPGATLTLVRLTAGPDTLTERILGRGRGGSWAAPGDELVGRPEATLRAVADAAAGQPSAPGDVSIETDGRTVDEVEAAIIADTGNWPRL